MKLYLKILFNIALVLISFGVILPYLISYPSTILVTIGFVYAFVVLPLFLYRFNRGIATQVMDSLK
jgi:hypothetical protein